MRYNVEADWQLLYTCNYRCPYCFIPPDTLGQPLTVYAEPEVWRRALDQTGLTWLQHITGGEPTIYPASQNSASCSRRRTFFLSTPISHIHRWFQSPNT
jgi:MoaA/NifB/PqqE/SkfB family radical SAM enzyme